MSLSAAKAMKIKVMLYCNEVLFVIISKFKLIRKEGVLSCFNYVVRVLLYNSAGNRFPTDLTGNETETYQKFHLCSFFHVSLTYV